MNYCKLSSKMVQLMKRKHLNDLIDWNNDEDRKPLLVIGARQVGKDYLNKDMFAETFYKNSYLRIDCYNNDDFINFVYKIAHY